MKASLLLSFLLASASCLQGQITAKHVKTNSKLTSGDTTHTFYFSDVNLDTCVSRLIAHWGNPIRNDTGHIVWMNIDIPGIGTGMKVLYTDMMCSDSKNRMFCRMFTSEKDKTKKLKKIKPSQHRVCDLEITDKTGKNPVNDKSKTEIVSSLLEKIVQ